MRAGEKVILAAQSDIAKLLLAQVVVGAEASVVQKARKGTRNNNLYNSSPVLYF
jgi:hypothetical protein